MGLHGGSSAMVLRVGVSFRSFFERLYWFATFVTTVRGALRFKKLVLLVDFKAHFLIAFTSLFGIGWGMMPFVTFLLVLVNAFEGLRHSRYIIKLIQVAWTIATITILLVFIRLVTLCDMEILMRDFILIPDYEILGCAQRTFFREHGRGCRCRSLLHLLVQMGCTCARLVE